MRHSKIFHDLDRLRHEVDRLFEETLSQTLHSAATWSPPVDIYEKEDTLVVTVELAGMKQEDIEVHLDGETLSIRGERRFERDTSGETFHRAERSYGKFQRSFTIGLPIDPAGAKATHRDGVLTVALPKQAQSQPRQVRVAVQ